MCGADQSNDKIHPFNPSKTDELEKMEKSLELPVTNRETTDVTFLTFFALFLTVSVCLVGYCIYYGDIGRVIHGYDNCGSVCGDSRRYKGLEECYRINENHQFGNYHLVYYKPEQTKLFDRICTNNCSNYPGYKEFLNRCLPTSKVTVLDKFFTKTGFKDFFVEVTEDFNLYWKVLVYSCLLALAVSLGFLLLFPFLAGFLVWVILTGVTVACLALSVYLWVSWKQLQELQKLDSEIEKREVYTYLGLAIVATVITGVIVLVIWVMVKRIKLVIQLFEEAGKAISVMPSILLIPFLSFLALIVTLSVWIYLCLWISGAGHLERKRDNVYYYKKDGFMEAAKVVNFLAMLWMVQFVIGCQHLIIANAVSRWFFTRDKSELKTPIFEGFYNLTRYHLGTVATGSFWLALVQLIRYIFAAVQKRFKNNSSADNYFKKLCLTVCNCCLMVLERVLNMISRNAYIITGKSVFYTYRVFNRWMVP